MLRSLVNSAPTMLVTALNEAVYLGLAYACLSLLARGVAALRES